MSLLKSQIVDITNQLMQAAFDLEDVRSPDPGRADESQKWIKEIARVRGRDLIYPMVPSGRASGPFVEMLDGSVKMDLITGIGVHLFGHGHPELILTGVKAALKGTTMQGTLMPGKEYGTILGELIKHAQPAAITGGWLSTCGTMVNELALKILRQKKAPAYKLISFKNCFAGRSSAMQELTDEPKYREGQPTFDQFTHIDFFDDALTVEANTKRTIEQIDAVLAKEPGKYCGVGFEVVQGEGGAFRSAPREWWVAWLSHARKQGLGIWFDEVQTFGRTGELFAYQRFGLSEYVDVVSLAKPLQTGAVLWTKDWAPKPGLIAGTFAGGTVSLSLGIKILEMLTQNGYLGPDGKIQKLERFIKSDLEARRERLKDTVGFGRINMTGGMICVEVLDGKADTIKAFLNKLFENGVIGFSAGRDPVMVRFLPPMGVFTEQHWLRAMEIFEKTLVEFKASYKPEVKTETV